MLEVNRTEIIGVSKWWTGVFLLVAIGVFYLGFGFAQSLQFTEQGTEPGIGPLAGLVGVVFVTTWIQARVNESVLLGILLTIALPVGFVIGLPPDSYIADDGLASAVALWLSGMAGFTGHFLGFVSADKKRNRVAA